MVDVRGQLWTWGDGQEGQLGHGDIRPLLVPTLFSGAEVFAQVKCGPFFNVVVTRAGHVV